MIQTVGFIGSGNVATNLAQCLNQKDIAVKFIFSKTKKNQHDLAKTVNAETPNSWKEIPEVDLIFICVNDDKIGEVAQQLSHSKSILVHCSGSVSMNKLAPSKAQGVFYPFQSISKLQPIRWSEVPILVESNRNDLLEKLKSLAQKISNCVLEANSSQRKQLHLSGVLINNFTNHLAVLSRNFIEKSHLSPELLNPILEETVRKITSGNPENGQTGPAIRNDYKTIEAHLAILENNMELKELYELFTKSIQNWHSSKD